MKLRALLMIGLAIAIALGASARAASEDDDSLGAKFKRIFAKHTPTPTPTPRKKPHKKPTPSPTPAANSAQASPGPDETAPASSAAEKSPSSDEVESTPAETPRRSSRAQVFEPVRPITPPPGSRRSTKPVATEHKATTTEENPPETPAQKSAASVVPKKTGASAPAISAAEIADYDNYPVEIRKVVDAGLDLSGKNLGYKYNSADPAKGGMDSSGFIYYVLSNAGIKDVPRDARDQYVWVRKAGNFQAVLSQRDDTFELNALKPGDLLFWANTSGPNRDPEVTQTMIYLGKDKETNQRLMVGATDGRSYKGQQRAGVSVFEFKVGRVKNAKSEEPGPAFVGYANIPGLAGD